MVIADGRGDASIMVLFLVVFYLFVVDFEEGAVGVEGEELGDREEGTGQGDGCEEGKGELHDGGIFLRHSRG